MVSIKTVSIYLINALFDPRNEKEEEMIMLVVRKYSIKEIIVLWLRWIVKYSTWRSLTWDLKCWIFVKLGKWES